MNLTTNNSIKIIRLQSGEDIIANYQSDDKNGMVMLVDPMHIIFKRLPTGKSVMLMMPWLPLEIIKENNALIYDSDILTIIDPKEELISYYINIAYQSQELLEDDSIAKSLMEEINYLTEEDLFEDEDEEEHESEIEPETLLEIMEQKKRNKLH
jgi:hypothetical protein